VLTWFDSLLSAAHAVQPLTWDAFVTSTGAHTSPALPAIVNVSLVPGRKLNPAPLHAYRVPPATDTTTGAPYPAGCVVLALTITGDTVSVITTFSIVTDPVFVTTIVYVTGSPIPGFAGAWLFTTV
jgi:hypothetical protein